MYPLPLFIREVSRKYPPYWIVGTVMRMIPDISLASRVINFLLKHVVGDDAWMVRIQSESLKLRAGKSQMMHATVSIDVIRIENCFSSCQICRRFDSIAEVAQCTDHAQCAHSLGLLAHRWAPFFIANAFMQKDPDQLT